MNGKGDTQRPCEITEEEMADNWQRIFGVREQRTQDATKAELEGNSGDKSPRKKNNEENDD